MNQRCTITFILGVIIFLTNTLHAQVTHWEISDLQSIGGHAVQVYGNPKVEIIQTTDEEFKATYFDGLDDGIVIDHNPLVGASSFTVEVVFMPMDKVPQEPRFVHFQQDDDNRVLVELRNFNAGEWYLDTFIKSQGHSNPPLIDDNNTHPTAEWQHASLVYANGQMAHYVNGELELKGAATYQKMTSGKLSLGMRMNQANFLKGYIREVRVTHMALNPRQFIIGQGRIEPRYVGTTNELRLDVGFELLELNLDDMFSGENLFYFATCDDESIAQVSTLGDLLMIKEIGSGQALISISAVGGGGLVTNDLPLLIENTLSSQSVPGDQLLWYPSSSGRSILANLQLRAQSDVTLRVWDMSGHLCHVKEYFNLFVGTHTLEIQAPELENGVFLFQVQTGEQLFRGKLLNEKHE